MKKFIIFLGTLIIVTGIAFILFEDYQINKYYMTN